MIWLLFLFETAGIAQDCKSILDDVRRFDEQKKFAESAAKLEMAVSVCSNAEDALLALARHRMLAEQLPQAQEAVARLLRLNPSHLAALKLKSDLHYLAGEDAKAEEALIALLKIDSKNEEGLYALGRLYYQQSRYQAACDQFHKTLLVNSKSYKAYDNLGLCYEGLNNTTEASKNYLKALDLVHTAHREYDWPYANFANFLINRGSYRQAFDLAAEAAERNPNSARNFYLAGKALFELKQVDKSVRWLTQSVTLDPQYPEPHYLLGRVYREQGKKDEAQREFSVFQELRQKAPRVLR